MNYGLACGAVLGLFFTDGLPVLPRVLALLGCAAVSGGLYVRPAFSVDRRFKRMAIRFLLLLAAAAAWYGFFPEYRYGLYQSARQAVVEYGPALALLWFLLNIVGRDLSGVGVYLRSLPVRCFFAPLMFGLLVDHVGHMPPDFRLSSPSACVSSVAWWVFYLDLVAGVLGYVLPAAVFRAGLQGVDTSLPGVFFCVLCYPPFWATIDQRFLGHDDGYSWAQWLPGNTVSAWAWALLIVVALGVYVGAVLSLGFRFSNLLYKGLCDAGLYSVCRHPQYLGKISYYWLTAVPFVGQSGPWAALSGCVGMAAVSWIYYMRAVTEERFLSNYPEYLLYAARVPLLPAFVLRLFASCRAVVKIWRFFLVGTWRFRLMRLARRAGA